jgi:capsular polysaccharide biosynthesis protein
MEERRDTPEIILSQSFRILLKKCYWIIACALIFALAAFFYTWNFVVPTYRSDIKLNVNVNQDAKGNNGVTVTVNNPQNLTLARTMVDTCIVILQSNDAREMIVEAAKEKRPDLMEGFSAGMLAGAVSASALNETEIFQVVVTDTVPARAELIADTIVKELPDYVHNINDGIGVTVVDSAKTASAVSLGFTRNIVIGVLIGVVLSSAVILWRAFSNPFIQEEEMITSLYGVPVLSTIPNLSNEREGKHYAYASYAYRKSSAQVENASDANTL